MTERLLELAPGVRCAVADNPGPMTLDGSRNYLVGEERAVLIDPGPPGPAQERRVAGLRGEGIEVAAVCLTHAHPDHAGGAAEVARRAGVPLAASRRALHRLGAEGTPLGDGEELPVDDGATELRAVATPGHSADHLCFLWTGEGSVFTGDLVLGSGTAMVGHPDGHMGDYLESLERLLELDPVRLYPGHGDPVDDPAERLEAYRRHRLDRERQIRDAVRAGAGSVREIRERVYPEVPSELAGAAAASIRAHLVHLEEEGEELPEIRGREAGDTVGH